MEICPAYRFDDFLADPVTWRLSRGGQEIHLEPVVLKLLIYLIENRGRLVTRRELMNTVWGDTVISESALTKAVARLRKALDDDPVSPRYLETVRSQGYRFVAAVEEIERPGAPDLPPAKGRAVPVPRFLLGGAAAVAVLVVLAVFWPDASQHERPQAEVIRSLAVLPLDNLTGDPEQTYYADGLQDLLITELSQLSGLRVTSRQSTIRYRDTRLPMADVAGELGVDALVEGSLFRRGEEIEITIQLIDGRSDEHLWAQRYTRDPAYVFDLISDATTAIGTELGIPVASPEADRLPEDRMGAVDPRAIDAYALGTASLDVFTEDGIRSAIEQFETAVALEPDFTLAWGQLGAAYAMQALFGHARPRASIERTRAASLQAIEADGDVPIGHSALGWARMWTGDFDGACQSFSKALRLNPWAPYAIHGDADCLMLDGRLDDSVERARQILVVSPFSAMHNWPLPSHLYVARRFDEAVSAAKAMQVRVPHFSMHWFLARAYWQQGQFDEALEEERLELQLRGDSVLLAALEEGLAAEGPTGAMRAMAEALVARAKKSYVDPYKVGETFARAGLADEAMRWLNKAVEHGSYEIMYIPFRADFDLLREDPRYQDLLERIFGQRAQAIQDLWNSQAKTTSTD